MIGILVDQLELGGKRWHSSVRKENHEPESGCARFGNIYACLSLLPTQEKKVADYFFVNGTTGNFKFIQTKEFELVFGSQIMH